MVFLCNLINSNKMKKYIIFFVVYFLLNQFCGFGQILLPDPISMSTTKFTKVNSGFGPRNYPGGSVFHPAIDYQLPVNASAYAIEPGNNFITSIVYDTSNGYVIASDWQYMHIKTGSANSNHWELANVSNVAYIFIRSGICSNSSNCTCEHAYSTNCNPGLLVKDPFTGKFINVECSMIQGSQIFVSRAGFNGSHLDLRRPSKDKNPFKFVAHKDAANNNIIVIPKFKRSIQTNNAIDFPNLPIKSSIYGTAIIVQAEIDATIDKDLDNLQMQISINGSYYNDLSSYYYTGPNANVTKSNVIQLSSIASIEKHSLNGIYPVYNVFGHLFFKYIWNSMELISGSTNPRNGLFPDGNYKIRILAHDVTGHEASSVTEKILDNKRPFIHKMEIFKSGFKSGTKIYNGEWNWDENDKKIVFSTQNISDITDQDVIYVRVYASEPMQNVNITAFGSTDSYNSVKVDSLDGLEWEYSYNPNTANTGIQNITINSTTTTDLAGNPLEGFSSTNSVSTFPEHNIDGSWARTYHMDDVVHQINPSQASTDVPTNVRATDNLPNKVAITWNNVSSSSAYYKVYRQEVDHILPTGSGYHPITEISDWIVGTRLNDITANPSTEYYYYVRSATNSNGDLPSTNSSSAIGKAMGNSSASFGYEQTSNSYQNYTIEFTDFSISDNEIVSWLWDFADGAPSVDQNPTHVYNETGAYSVTLTTIDDQNIRSEYTETIYVTDQILGSFSVDCSASTTSCEVGENINLTGIVSGGTAPYNYRFSLGDGSTKYYSNVQSSFQNCEVFSYSKAKVYQVVLTATDKDGLQAIYSFRINVKRNFELDVTYSTVPAKIFVGKTFRVAATVANPVLPLHWFLWVNSASGDMSTDEKNKNCKFYKSDNFSSDYLSSEIPGLAEGTFQCRLIVYDNYGGQKDILFSIIVSESKDPKIDVNLMQTDCSKQTEFPMGATISLQAWANVNQNKFLPRYDGVKMIKWFYDAPYPVGQVVYNTTFDFQSSDDAPPTCCINSPFCGGFPKCSVCKGYFDMAASHCFQLTGSEGNHTIRLEAYGGAMSVNGPNKVHPFFLVDNELFSSVTKKIVLVNCNKVTTITEKIQLNDPAKTKAGYISILPTNEIKISQGENITLTAYNSIEINPAIVIMGGANFIAELKDCPKIPEECGGCTQNFIRQINKNAQNDSIPNNRNLSDIKSNIQVYPNPTANLLYIDLRGNISDILYYEIYNSLGKLICKKIPTNEIEEYNLEGNSAGLYLFSATFANGNIELKRILYTK